MGPASRPAVRFDGIESDSDEPDHATYGRVTASSFASLASTLGRSLMSESGSVWGLCVPTVRGGDIVQGIVCGQSFIPTLWRGQVDVQRPIGRGTASAVRPLTPLRGPAPGHARCCAHTPRPRSAAPHTHTHAARAESSVKLT